MDFSHLDASGAPRMVDVSAKTESKRTAIARSVVHISASTLELLKAKALPKGDVLTVAQIAGIMAAKRTSEFIPMCHPLALTHTDVRFLVRFDSVLALTSTMRGAPEASRCEKSMFGS